MGQGASRATRGVTIEEATAVDPASRTGEVQPVARAVAASADVPAVSDAYAALERGAFAEAEELARRRARLVGDPAGHLLLGQLAYLDGRLDEARGAWELAFRGLRDAGEPRAAARVATELVDLYAGLLGQPAVGNGWAARARRVLEQVGPCVEWGYLELARIACDRPDIDDLLRGTERALAIAAEFADPDLHTRALADSGLALVSRGRARDGFARLDEALVAITAGEVRDAGVIGRSFCSLLSSCDRAGDLARAEEWIELVRTALLDRFGGRPRVLHAHCQAAYGSLLCGAGRWAEAEEAMLAVLGPAGAWAGYGHRADTAAALATMRVAQGRVDEAAELIVPYLDRPTTRAPSAAVHLARGEADVAAAVVRRGLREFVGDRVRGGELLDLLVSAELARGDLAAADDAARRLAELAHAADGGVLAARAALARGRVLAGRGDHGGAVAAFEDARARLAGGERPLLAATAGLECALAYAAAGRADDAAVDAGLALAVLERLGAAPGRDRALALLRSLGPAGQAGRRAAGGPARRPDSLLTALAALTAREREVLELVRQGLSNADIGARLYITPKTAEHHVGRILGKLGVRGRAEAAAFAEAARHGPPPGAST